MNFLSIDCSTDIGSLFVKTKNKTFGKILQSNKSNNDLLMKQILDFFKANNLHSIKIGGQKFDDISHILINQGPGNFSGLRSSLSTAKGISMAKNLKLLGYDNFIWLCAKFYKEKKFIYSLIKFREKYFIKGFDSNLNSIRKAKEITKDEIIEKYDKKFKVISKSATKHFEDRILKLNNLNVVNLDHNMLENLKLRGLLDEDLIKPLYLS